MGESRGTAVYKAFNKRKGTRDHSFICFKARNRLLCSMLHASRLAPASKRLPEPLKMPLPAAGQLGFSNHELGLPVLAALGRRY